MLQVDALQGRLARDGLNAFGVADGRPWDDVLPGCRSVVVVGSGGPGLWQGFLAFIVENPAWLNDPHPLDRYVHLLLTRADPAPPPTRRWIRCAADETEVLDFRRLAVEAGLGWRSALELVIHPSFGLWIGLRAACFTVDDLGAQGPLPGPGPCATCPAPCVTACPGSAIERGKWDLRRCADHRATTADCDHACHARAACPEGADHRYDPVEHAYHHRPDPALLTR